MEVSPIQMERHSVGFLDPTCEYLGQEFRQPRLYVIGGCVRRKTKYLLERFVTLDSPWLVAALLKSIAPFLDRLSRLLDAQIPGVANRDPQLVQRASYAHAGLWLFATKLEQQVRRRGSQSADHYLVITGQLAAFLPVRWPQRRIDRAEIKILQRCHEGRNRDLCVVRIIGVQRVQEPVHGIERIHPTLAPVRLEPVHWPG